MRRDRAESRGVRLKRLAMRLRSCIIILWVLWALLMAFESEASNARNEISYAQGRLTAHVVEVNLKEVLLAVAKEAKLEFSLDEEIATKKVSIWFDKLPLEKGIKRIIRPFSCSMIFDSSGRLKRVVIIKSGSNSEKVTISGRDDDPSQCPAGQSRDEGPLPGALGPGNQSEMADPPQDYDPSLGPAGRLDEGLPQSAPGPGLEGEMVVVPEMKYPTPSAKGP